MSATQVARVRLFDTMIDNVDMADAIDRIEDLVARGAPSFVVTPNVDQVVRLHDDPGLRAAYEDAALVLADGMPIVWSSRWLGRPLRARVTGADLLPRVCERAAERGWSVFLLGAADGVAARAAARLQRQYPSLRVSGTYAPPRGFELDPVANAAAIQAVRSAQPELLVVGLGAPRQERWLHAHRAELAVPVSFALGAAIDFAAGEVRRAPAWMQQAGLEWLFRFSREPRRLFRRYFIDDLRFVLLLAREWRRVRREDATGPTRRA